jgi:hypothetical protein
LISLMKEESRVKFGDNLIVHVVLEGRHFNEYVILTCIYDLNKVGALLPLHVLPVDPLRLNH